MQISALEKTIASDCPPRQAYGRAAQRTRSQVSAQLAYSWQPASRPWQPPAWQDRTGLARRGTVHLAFEAGGRSAASGGCDRLHRRTAPTARIRASNSSSTSSRPTMRRSAALHHPGGVGRMNGWLWHLRQGDAAWDPRSGRPGLLAIALLLQRSRSRRCSRRPARAGPSGALQQAAARRAAAPQLPPPATRCPVAPTGEAAQLIGELERLARLHGWNCCAANTACRR